MPVLGFWLNTWIQKYFKCILNIYAYNCVYTHTRIVLFLNMTQILIPTLKKTQVCLFAVSTYKPQAESSLPSLIFKFIMRCLYISRNYFFPKYAIWWPNVICLLIIEIFFISCNMKIHIFCYLNRWTLQEGEQLVWMVQNKDTTIVNK